MGVLTFGTHRRKDQLRSTTEKPLCVTRSCILEWIDKVWLEIENFDWAQTKWWHRGGLSERWNLWLCNNRFETEKKFPFVPLQYLYYTFASSWSGYNIFVDWKGLKCEEKYKRCAFCADRLLESSSLVQLHFWATLFLCVRSGLSYVQRKTLDR